MNYIAEIRAFYDWLEMNEVEASHISLWHGLMHIANKVRWQQDFTVPMSTLEFKTGLKRSSIYRARNKLKQLGLIDFRERSGSQASVYTVFSLCSTQTHNPDAMRTQRDTQPYSINKHKQNIQKT